MSEDVIVKRNPASLSIVLNRPQAINSLTISMIDTITQALHQAAVDESIQFIILYGNGQKGFCAGGDIKKLYQASIEGNSHYIKEFYSKEYALDYLIHTYPKPVIVCAHGITMGGGMGLAAGATQVVVTEHTVMAMPESRIGFFPDVGATGWLFNKCKNGYPKYLALTGDELIGEECVHVGLAHYQVLSHTLPNCIEELERVVADTYDVRIAINKILQKYSTPVNMNDTQKDKWVAQYFNTDSPLQNILQQLSQCSIEHELCNGVFNRIAERSPTSLVITDLLLKENKGRPLKEVFARELNAAIF
ncbi:MAG: enoyl-CoA hydratase/isomerase family protein, partial [Spirochaetes bacterium]|nr:enoyl-CoA hydratase/isomerase family protein [Spirochaetota bacterium]